VIRPVLLLANIVLIGCTVVPTLPPTGATTAPERADRVVALVGSVGAMSLVTPGPGASLRPLDDAGLPTDAAWLSSSGGMLLATTLVGRTVLGATAPGTGGAGSPGGIAWSPAPGDLGGNHQERAFGSLEPVPAAGGRPAARRVAFVEGDPGSGAPGLLIVETLTGTEVRPIELPRAAESAPAWLPDGRIVVVVRDQADWPVALIADPASGRVAAAGPATLRSVAIGGTTVATIGADGMVRIGTVTTWLGGQPGDPVLGIGADEPVLQAQPSVAGDELVLVVADPAGDAASIRILAGSGGWHEIARFELPPGANRAVVGWLAGP
jgi:hypothetical protein